MILRQLRAFLIWAMILLISFLIALYGAISVPVLAFNYIDIYKNFSNYEVINYDNIPLVLNKDTFNNAVYGYSIASFGIKFSSCPASNFGFTLYSELVSPAYYDFSKSITIQCSTSQVNYSFENKLDGMPSTMLNQIKEAITTPNDASIDLYTGLFFGPTTLWNGVQLTFTGLELKTLFYYEFNTTYYYDHIAADTDITYIQNIGAGSQIANIPGESDAKTYLLVGYSSTDYYRIYNSDYTISYTLGRKKYNVPLGQRVVSYGIGLGVYAVAPFNSGKVVLSPTASRFRFRGKIYLINYSNTQQTFPGASLPTLEYQTCNAWEIPCHLGNALVYIGKDLPITSDIYSILSRAWQVVSNGMYAVNNIFGAVFDSGGLVSGNFFGIALMVAFGIGLTTMIITGGDDDD